MEYAAPPQATPAHSKRKFSSEEDDRLTQLVTRLGETNWKNIANQMGTRNCRQCRERWKNYLAPYLNRDPWSAEEDAILLQKYDEFGSQWSLITKFFPLRTDVNIKNHWVVISGNQSQTRRTRRKPAKADGQQPRDEENIWSWNEADVREGYEEAGAFGLEAHTFLGFGV
jgi:hypothetical protein